jgi:hypothetical protein
MKCWSWRLINFLIKLLTWHTDLIANIVDVNFYVWAFRRNIVSDKKFYNFATMAIYLKKILPVIYEFL